MHSLQRCFAGNNAAASKLCLYVNSSGRYLQGNDWYFYCTAVNVLLAVVCVLCWFVFAVDLLFTMGTCLFLLIYVLS